MLSNSKGEDEMSKYCTQCKGNDGVTRCDHCDQYTCRNCLTIISKPNGQIEVKHSDCVRKRKVAQ